MIIKLIDRLGTYLQLDLRYYIKNYAYLISAQAVNVLIGLLLSITFARLLTRDLYGQWNYIFSILGILTILTMPGMNAAITQAVARGYDRTLIEGTRRRFKWSFLAVLAVLGVGLYYFFFSSDQLGKSLVIAAIFLPFYASFQTYGAFLSGKKRFKKLAVFRIIIQLVSVAVTILVIYFLRDLMLILIAYLLSASALTIYFYRLTTREMENATHDQQAMRFGKHITVQNIPGVLTSWGDLFIIGAFLTFPELAVYSIAKGFSMVVRSALGPVAGLSFPKLAVMEEKEAYSAVKKKFAYLLLLTVIMCSAVILLCPYIIPFLYSARYLDSILYSQILVGSLIFGIPTSMFVRALFPSQRKTRELYLIRIRALIEIVLIVILAINFGLLGVVLAKLLASLLGLIFSLKLAKWF